MTTTINLLPWREERRKLTTLSSCSLAAAPSAVAVAPSAVTSVTASLSIAATIALASSPSASASRVNPASFIAPV